MMMKRINGAFFLLPIFFAHASMPNPFILVQNGESQACIQDINDNNPDSLCIQQQKQSDNLAVSTPDANFPYGNSPKGNVCVSSDYYATPETLLGSWAMVQAAAKDTEAQILPRFLSGKNTVYAVGTAAIGNQLGIANCSGGCNQLNGYCFALKFEGKTRYPYMIFQSVNIGANYNSFDIYMAGGGSGAFPASCAKFWGTDSSVNWANHIQNTNCFGYFGDYSTIKSTYSVTYNGVVHSAKSTLESACTYASAEQTGFNTRNWDNVQVVPVTCPSSLVQITGIALPSRIKTVGNQAVHDLSTLQDSDFSASTISPVTTTQMQDCKTPSSGYCNNVATSIPDYEASISANLRGPLLAGEPASNTYCQAHPGTNYCSWNNGQSSAGGSYCNASASQCTGCGGGSKWCVCNGQTLSECH